MRSMIISGGVVSRLGLEISGHTGHIEVSEVFEHLVGESRTHGLPNFLSVLAASDRGCSGL